ncbi:hypothetical protein KEM56_003491 [Ascosphaera pollenicola]|nr:hypothetical protein KEM56_003491 [Ascosphaera pollenicola]
MEQLPSYEDANKNRPYIPPSPDRRPRRNPNRRVSAPPPRYPSAENYDPEAQAAAVILAGDDWDAITAVATPIDESIVTGK